MNAAGPPLLAIEGPILEHLTSQSQDVATVCGDILNPVGVACVTRELDALEGVPQKSV